MAKLNASGLIKSTQGALDFLSSIYPHTNYSCMLWGPPGIGKSSIIQQLCNRIGYDEVVTVLIANMDPLTLGGLPARHPDDPSKMTFLTPDIWPTKKNCIVFLDEISNAGPTQQNLALQALLEHRCGPAIFPEGTIVIGAGNESSNSGLVQRMAQPTKNRMLHLEVTPAWQDSTRDYFVNAGGIPRSVIAFLDAYPDRLFNLPNDPSMNAFPTPRSWEMAARSIFNIDKASDGKGISRELARQVIHATLGPSVASDFSTFHSTYATIKPKEIINDGDLSCLTGNLGPNEKPDLGTLCAASAQILSYCLQVCGANKSSGMSKDQCENLMKFIEVLPADMVILFYRDLGANTDGASRSLKNSMKRYDVSSPKWKQAISNLRHILID